MRHILKRDRPRVFKRIPALDKSQQNYLRGSKITQVLESGCWVGKRCFLIAGGESLIGFDFSKLDSELTIGINKVFEFYPKAKINYMMDILFYEAIHKKENLLLKWCEFEGLKVFLSPFTMKNLGPDVYLVKRIKNFEISLNLGAGVYGGSNSGVGALMLAIALGANPIYLLGYDLKCSKQSHWHGGYGDNRDLIRYNRKLGTFTKDFESISSRKDGKLLIVNLSSDSELKCFPFEDVNKILCPHLKM